MAEPGPGLRGWPAGLAEIARLIGAPAALALASAIGGVRTYVPKPDYLTEDHPIVRAIGLEAARRLAGLWGGDHLVLPNGAGLRSLKVQLARAFDAGASNRRAALTAGCTQRYAEMVRRATRDRSAGRQGDLFAASDHPAGD